MRNNLGMQIVNADWIKARLTGRHGEKADIARAAGLSSKQLSYILGGDRKVSQKEATALLAYFGETPAEPAPGMAESPVAPFRPSPDSAIQIIANAVQKRGGHPAIYNSQTRTPDMSIERGDKIVIDMKQTPEPGDLVVCTIISDDAAQTHIRRYLPPWLVAGQSFDQITDGGNAAVLGRVISIIRDVAAS